MTTVSYEVRDNIAEILLDSPPVNALNEAMIDALLQEAPGSRGRLGTRRDTGQRRATPVLCRAATR
jgi:hypothetical protein